MKNQKINLGDWVKLPESHEEGLVVAINADNSLQVELYKEGEGLSHTEVLIKSDMVTLHNPSVF